MLTLKLRLAAASLLAALCSAPAVAQDPVTPSGTQRTPLANRAPVDYLNEKEAVGLLETVDEAEAEVARLALERSKNDDVLEHARHMIADHDDAKRQLGDLGITSEGSEARRRMKDRARMTTNRLKRLEGNAFDRAYIASQIENHEMVLNTIDEKVIPHAKTGALAAHVQDRRPVVQSHLDEARRIKSRLGTK